MNLILIEIKPSSSLIWAWPSSAPACFIFFPFLLYYEHFWEKFLILQPLPLPPLILIKLSTTRAFTFNFIRLDLLSLILQQKARLIKQKVFLALRPITKCGRWKVMDTARDSTRQSQSTHFHSWNKQDFFYLIVPDKKIKSGWKFGIFARHLCLIDIFDI